MTYKRHRDRVHLQRVRDVRDREQWDASTSFGDFMRVRKSSVCSLFCLASQNIYIRSFERSSLQFSSKQNQVNVPFSAGLSAQLQRDNPGVYGVEGHHLDSPNMLSVPTHPGNSPDIHAPLTQVNAFRSHGGLQVVSPFFEQRERAHILIDHHKLNQEQTRANTRRIEHAGGESRHCLEHRPQTALSVQPTASTSLTRPKSAASVGPWNEDTELLAIPGSSMSYPIPFEHGESCSMRPCTQN